MGSPQQQRASLEAMAAITPTDLADDIRAATARVHVCAQAWRQSAYWRGDKLHRKAYEQVVTAAVELDSVPQVLVER
jgi:hypothetical protein